MKKTLTDIFNENPLFVLCLGLCPALIVTTTLENGYMIGLSIFIVMLLSNVVISLVSRLINESWRFPIYIIIVALFVTILQIVIQSNIPDLEKTLGIYIPLITVNCVILYRALSFVSDHNVIDGIVDSLKIGLGYTLTLSLIGLIRELLGDNTITIMDKISNFTGYVSKYGIFPKNDLIPNSLFLTPAGSLLIIGLLLGVVNAIRHRGDEK